MANAAGIRWSVPNTGVGLKGPATPLAVTSWSLNHLNILGSFKICHICSGRPAAEWCGILVSQPILWLEFCTIFGLELFSTMVAKPHPSRVPPVFVWPFYCIAFRESNLSFELTTLYLK